MANEPRAYREAVAEALREARPDVDFVVVEPGELAGSVLLLKPEFVICNEAIVEVCEEVSYSLELYPNQSPHSVLRALEECFRVENVQLSDLISIVEQAVDGNPG